MALTLRLTGLSSGVYKDWADYTVMDSGQEVGRIYEDRTAPSDRRWFWLITVYVDPARELTTSSRTATLEEAKELFRKHWEAAKRAD